MKKQINKIDRSTHAGKGRQEREDYQNFLRSKFSLEKTEVDPEDTKRTRASSIEEESEPTSKPIPKSLWLKIKDFFREYFVVSGILVLVLGAAGTAIWYISSYNERISSLEKNVQKNTEQIEKNNDKVSIIEQTIAVIKAESAKDIENLKKLFDLLHKGN